MTIRSALSSQFGIADEVTYGVPVVPTRFWPLVPGGDGLKTPRAAVESDSIYAGARTARESQRSPGLINPGGDVGMELFDRSLGLLFKHMFGNLVTTGSGPYTHTATPGELTGKSFTAQCGRTDSGTGVVHPMTYAGSKVASWEIGLEEGKNAMLGVTILARDELGHTVLADGVTDNGSPLVTSAIGFSIDMLFSPISGAGIPANSYIGEVVDENTISLSSSNDINTPVNATADATGVALTIGLALAAVSYPAGLMPLSYLGSHIEIGGSPYKVKKLKLAGDNKLADDRTFIGSRLRDEPLEVDVRAYTGQLDSEFFDLTAYERFTSFETAALVATFGLGTSSVEITQNVRFTGTTPTPSDRGIIQQQLPYEALGSTNDASTITAVLVNGDSAP